MMDIDELERLMKVATPGPWSKAKSGVIHKRGLYGAERHLFERLWDDEQGLADEAFVLAACNALPGLIAEVRRLEAIAIEHGRNYEAAAAEVKRLREVLEKTGPVGKEFW